MIALLSLAFAGSEVFVDATAECVITVDGRSETVKARKSEKFKVDAGQVAIAVSDQWTGTLDLPNRTEVRLGCDGTSVALLGAKKMPPPGAGVAKTAMGVAAGAAAVGDAAGALNEAGQDMSAVSRGEMPANGSSRTEVTVSAGPGGFSSSTSRTTAGPGGIQHDSSSTSVGPGGISRTTASGTLDGSGATYAERSMGGSIQLPAKGGTVSLTRTGGADVAAAGAEASGAGDVSTPAPQATPAPQTAPAPAAPPPKEVAFSSPGMLTDADLTAEIRDPIGTEGETKLNVKVSARDSFVVFDTAAVQLERPDGPLATSTDKRVVLPPGKAKGTTLVWPGDHRVKELRLHLHGIQRVVEGDAVPAGTSALDAGTRTALGGATCVVDKSKVSAKEARLTLECTAEQPVIVDAAALAAASGSDRVVNADKKATAHLVWPEETTRIDLTFPAPPDGAQLDWTGAVHAAKAIPVDFGPRPMTASW